MTTTINASTSSGLVQTADTSGALALQTANTTALTISSGQVVTLANALPAGSGGTGQTNITFPSSGGTAMVTGNMPTFSAYSSSATTVPDNVFTKVLYATENWDTNNNFANSRFTPTVAGYYQINANTRYGSITSSNNAFRIFKNGSAYVQGATCGLVNGYIYMMVTALVYMNGTTDYVEIYAYQASGVSQNTDIDVQEQFSGCLVRSA